MHKSAVSRLVNIKGTYESALMRLENPTPLDGAIALVLMDNALEAAFKLVLEDVDIKTREPVFPVLLDRALCDDALYDIKALKRQIVVLRAARNGFQHQGIIPDLSIVVNEYKPLTEQTLKCISKQKFSIEWQEVSLSLLIQTEMVKKLFNESEKAFGESDFATSAAYLIFTFEAVKFLAQMKIFGSGLSSIRNAISTRYRKDDPFVKYVTTLDEEIEIFKLGLDYAYFRNYLDLANVVGINSILYQIPSLELNVVKDFSQKLSGHDKDLLAKWYLDMKDFMLKFVLRAESNERISLQALTKLLNGLTKSWAINR